MTEGSEEGCHATMAAIADHARHHAVDELSRRSPLALAVQLGHPELPQRRRRRTQRCSDVGVPAEDPSKAVGRFASRRAFSARQVLMPWRLPREPARVAMTL